MLLLTEALSAEARMVRDEGAVVEPSMAPSVGVQIGAEVTVELEQSATALAVPPTKWSRAQSSTDFLMVSSMQPPTGDLGKVQIGRAHV